MPDMNQVYPLARAKASAGRFPRLDSEHYREKTNEIPQSHHSTMAFGGEE